MRADGVCSSRLRVLLPSVRLWCSSLTVKWLLAAIGVGENGGQPLSVTTVAAVSADSGSLSSQEPRLNFDSSGSETKKEKGDE